MQFIHRASGLLPRGGDEKRRFLSWGLREQPDVACTAASQSRGLRGYMNEVTWVYLSSRNPPAARLLVAVDVFRPCERAPFRCQNTCMIPNNLLLLVGAATLTFLNIGCCRAFLCGTRPTVPVRAANVDGRRRGVHSSRTCGRPPSHQTLRGKMLACAL